MNINKLLLGVGLFLGLAFQQWLNATLNTESAYAHIVEQMNRYHSGFDVYTDQDAGGNHFIPSGWMGDWGDISFAAHDTTIEPHSGANCLKLGYSAEKSQGLGWAGIYWQYPENNWGNLEGHYDLR